MACLDDDSAMPANCFAPGFVPLTEDSHRWNCHRRFRVPCLHRRPPTFPSAYSGLHVFVPLAWNPPGVVWMLRSSTLWNETRAAGVHHLIEPLSGLNSINFVKRVLRKCCDV